jgi:hypothetical protein
VRVAAYLGTQPSRCKAGLVLGDIPVTFQGPEEYVSSQGVKVEILNDPTCIYLMRDFIKAKPELWNEDIEA